MLPFPLDRPLTWFDLETTGKNPTTARIVEATIVQFMPDGSTKPWTARFNPGVPIPAEATAKHGITDDMVKDLPMFLTVAERILPAFRRCDYGGYNVRYDIDVLKAEYARLNINTERAADDPPPRIIDGLRLWQIVEPRTLTDFLKRWTGKTLEDAHSATADVMATIEGVEALLAAVSPDVLPRDLQKLHDMQFPRDPNAVDSNGLFVKGPNGDVLFNFGKHAGKPVKSEKAYFKWWKDQPGRNTAEYRKLADEVFAK